MAKLGEILKKFQCPVCKEYVVPPIPQCVNGHIICPQCRKEKEACPLCNSAFSPQRNQTLEAIASDVPFPCKFSRYGCEELNYLAVKEAHEKECTFQPFKCPYCDAEIASYSDALMQHLSKAHETKPIFKNCVEIGIKIEDLKEIQSKKSLRVHCIMEKFKEAFVFSIHYMPEKQEWYFILQIYGQPNKAECYRGSLEMTVREKQVRYEGKVKSWSENVEEIVKENECLILSDKYFREGFYGGILLVDIKPVDQSTNVRRRRSQPDVMSR